MNTHNICVVCVMANDSQYYNARCEPCYRTDDRSKSTRNDRSLSDRKRLRCGHVASRTTRWQRRITTLWPFFFSFPLPPVASRQLVIDAKRSDPVSTVRSNADIRAAQRDTGSTVISQASLVWLCAAVAGTRVVVWRRDGTARDSRPCGVRTPVREILWFVTHTLAEPYTATSWYAMVYLLRGGSGAPNEFFWSPRSIVTFEAPVRGVCP